MSDLDKPLVVFTVEGRPVPKQSFRYARNGRKYTPARVKNWQSTVGWEARRAYQGDPVSTNLGVRLLFRLPDNRRRDGDNLAKGVLDACNGILWEDDRQVMQLEIKKCVDASRPGVDVSVYVAP